MTYFLEVFHSMSFLSDIWATVPELINNKFDNGLDKRDFVDSFLELSLNKIKPWNQNL